MSYTCTFTRAILESATICASLIESYIAVHARMSVLQLLKMTSGSHHLCDNPHEKQEIAAKSLFLKLSADKFLHVQVPTQLVLYNSIHQTKWCSL